MVLLFVVAAIIQYSIFSSSVSMCGYSTIFVPLIMAFSRALMHDCDISNKKRSLLFGLTGMSLIYVGSYDFKTVFFLNDSDPYHTVLNLQEIPYMNVPFEYSSSEDADLAKLHALKGNRVHYNVKPELSDQNIAMTTMSLRFAVEE